MPYILFSIVFLKGRERLVNIKVVQIQVESRFNIHIKYSFIGGHSHILAGLPECAYFPDGITRHSLRREILHTTSLCWTNG